MSNLYIETISVVGGILTPVALLLLIKLGIELSQEHRERLEYRREELEKVPPFDDEAEFYKVPNDRMIGVRLMKDGVVVWDGAIEKEQL